MKTLFHKQYEDPVLDAIILSRSVYDLAYRTLCIDAINDELDFQWCQKNGKPYKNGPQCNYVVKYKNKSLPFDAIKEIKRMINLLNRSVDDLPVSEDDPIEDQIDWFIEEGAKAILDLYNTNNIIAKALCHQLAQVAEKGFKKDTRKHFGIGIVNGEPFDGTLPEVVQAGEYCKAGGPGEISNDAKNFTVHNNGEIVSYAKKSRKDAGKQLDLLITTRYLTVYTTNKALTARKDGGGRTSEYETDLAGTLQKRAKRFYENGFEINEDGKIVLVVGQIDSRFFNLNPKAVKLIQDKCGHDGDTFVSDSITLGKFIKMIDVPKVLQEPEKVIGKAFNKLSTTV